MRDAGGGAVVTTWYLVTSCEGGGHVTDFVTLVVLLTHFPVRHTFPAQYVD